METKDFIIELEKKDMKLWLNEEGGLAFKGPKNFMTDDLLNQIKERKEEIVECLKRERFIKHDEKGKYLQFPLNDMQSAYYSGMKRIYELGGTSCYTYLELEVPQIDVLKLEQAWHQVIAKHDMLRAIVSKDGMQQILEKVLLPRLVVYRLLYEELLCRLHCIIYEFLTGISYVVLNDLYNNVGLLTSDPTTLLLPKSIAVVEENVS